MRTTVTLDTDVFDKLQRLARQRRTSFKETLNAVLRRGLSGQSTQDVAGGFAVTPFEGGFCPGIDGLKLNQLLDDLEAEDFLREHQALLRKDAR